MRWHPINRNLFSAVLVMFAVVLGLSIACSSGSDDTITGTPIPTWEDGGRLLHKSRTMLKVCVDATGSDDPGVDIEKRVEDALEQILVEPNIPDEYKKWDVSEGCPEPRVQWQTPIYYLDIERPNVEVPSEYLLMVYFVPDSDLTSTFVDDEYVSVPVEMQCEGDQCWPATQGLFVPYSANEALLDEGLKDALVLRPYTPDIDPTIDPARCLATVSPPKPPGQCDVLRPGS